MGRSALFGVLARAVRAAQREQLRALADSGWSRRRFLGATALAGSAVVGAVPRRVFATPTLPQGRGIKVAVVGGGLAGLSAAYRLMQAGVQVALYEASARLGGRVLSATGVAGDGLVTELGGEFINTNHADMLALASELGLRLFDRSRSGVGCVPPATAYFLAGKARDEADVARLLRPLAKQIADDAALLEHDYARHAPGFDRLSVANYLDQHAALVTEPFIRGLIESSIRTEFGVEPAQASALQLLFNLPSVRDDGVEVLGQSDEALSIEGGNSLLALALARALGPRVSFGKRLVGVAARDGRGTRLSFQDGPTLEADYVILALPFTVLRGVAFDPPLPVKLRRFIDEVDLGANEKLIAGFSQRAWHRPGGFRGEAWTDQGFSEVWDATQRQPQMPGGALTFLMGGRDARREGRPATDVQGREWVGRLDVYVPGVAKAATGRYLRTDWVGSPLSQGAYTSFRPGQLTEFGDLMWVEADAPDAQQEVRVGRVLFAGEHLSDAFYGFMNGAAQTGRLAAQAALRLAGG